MVGEFTNTDEVASSSVNIAWWVWLIIVLVILGIIICACTCYKRNKTDTSLKKQEQAINIWMQTGLNDDNKYKGSTDARNVATMRQQQRVKNYGDQATFVGQPLGVHKEDEKRRME